MVYDAPSTGRRMVAAMRACHDRLTKDGVDFGAYNTTENATDFHDLQVALGIPSWNVYGVSYGTDLALTYERMFPEGLRSVTVDSVVPPQLTRYGLFWSMAGGGIATILDACAKQASCHKAYPNPKAQLTQLVRRYEKRPLVGTVKPVLFPGDEPEPEPRAKATRTVIDGGAFINWVAGFSNVLAPNLPRLLDQLVHGDKRAERDALRSWNASKHAHEGVYSFGLQNGVVCSEWAPHSTVANTIGDGRAQFPGFPRSVLAQAPQFPWMAEICAAWPVTPAPAVQHTATTGDIPTLIINGGYDAITASEIAAQVAPPLANATFVNVPGIGHFVVPHSPCAYAVMTSFLDALKPDTGRIAQMRLPRFAAG